MRIVTRLVSFDKIPFVILFLLFHGIFISDAFAYIDPGSGSIVIQALIGALVGVGITVKIYWYKIKINFLTTKSKE